MTFQAKISAADQAVSSAPQQTVGKTIATTPGSNVTLNIRPDAVASFSRHGSDLIVHLKSGEVLRVVNFYANPNLASHLYLVESDKLVLADVGTLPAGGSLAAAYTAEAASAGFDALPAVAGSSFLGGSGLLVAGGLAAAGGVAAAVGSSGGGRDSSSPPPGDTVPPGAPVITPSNGTTLGGTAEAGSLIKLTDGTGQVIGQVSAGANGNWSFTPTTPLADGTVVHATATDAAGNVSQQATATIDAVAPIAPTITPTNGAALHGTAEAGSTVTLTDGSGHAIGTVTADASGHWSYTPTAPLADGTVVHVTATDAAGNVSPQGTTTVDALAPGAPVIDPSTGAILSGTAEAGSTVTLTDGSGHAIGTTVADASGHWSFSPLAPLAAGTVVDATATDAAGNVSPQAATTITITTVPTNPGDTTPPVAPVIDPSRGTALTGTAEAGSRITLTDGSGHAIGTVLTDGGGHWSFTPSPALADGEVVHATATDAAGNISPQATVTIDAVAPGAPVIAPTNGSIIIGTAEAGSHVTLTDGSGHAIGTAVADGSGNWSITPASPLGDGTVVDATATDAAGNVSIPGTATVDAAVPSVPALAPTNGIAISGTADPGDTITLTDGAGHVFARFAVASNGHWTYTPTTPLANGTVIHATATDAAGNVSAESMTTVDTVLPAQPTIMQGTDAASGHTVLSGTADVGDTIQVAVDGVPQGTVSVGSNGTWTFLAGTTLANNAVVTVTATNGAHASASSTLTIDGTAPALDPVPVSNGQNFSGTAEAGATITVTDSGNHVLGTTVAASNGQWNLHLVVRVTSPVTVTATDAVGNHTQTTVAVATAAPAAPVVDISNGTVVQGTGTPGDTVTITDGAGNMLGQAAVDAGGTWTMTPTHRLDTGTVLHVVQTDAVGNVSQQGATVVDATPPPLPGVNPTNGTTLTGTAEAGAVIVVTSAGGTPIGAPVTAAGDGTWSWTAPSPLADGTVLKISATDTAGNTSAQATAVVDAQAPAAPVVSDSSGAVVVGTAEAGSIVTLKDGGGTTLGTTVTDASGHWTFVPTGPIADNTVVNATATDAAGNVSGVSSITIDATLPSIPTIGPSNGTVLTGTGDIGDTITLTDGSGAVIGTATVNAGGTWSFTPGAPLADGTVVHATASDGGLASAQAIAAIDAAAPLAPVAIPSNGTSVSGTAEAGSIVTVTDDNGSVIGQVTTGANGQWSLTGLSLADGTILHATATDAAGNVSVQGTLTVDATPPAVPVMAPSNGTALSGTAEAGSTITLTDSGGAVIGHATVDANGYWTFTQPTPFTNGVTVHATATDAAGNVSGQSTIAIDASAPTAPIIATSNGTTISGTAEASSAITITLTDANGNVIGHTVTGVDGHWSFTPTTPLANGTVVDVTATDAAGNTSLVSATVVDTIAPAAPTIGLSNGVLLSGTAEAGSIVTLTDGAGHAIGVTIAAANGSWSFLSPAPLIDGTLVNATATDAAGNVSAAGSVTVDASPPITPVLTSWTATAIGGTGEVGSIISITDANGNLIGQTLVRARGEWLFVPLLPLANGQTIHIVATDATGNSSALMTTTIDAIAPDAPVIAPSNGAALAGTAEAGATITLTDANGNPIGTTTADATGHWAFTPATALANAALVHATATDMAGNVSAQATITVDSIAPGAPVIDATNGVVVHGTAEIGSIVTVTDGNGNVIGQAVTDGTGHWTLTPAAPLADGTVLRATAVDTSGNVSTAASPVSVDASPPTAPVIAPSNGVTVHGTAEANSTITLADANGNAIGTTTTDATGHWTFTPGSQLADGTIVNATATDAAGNASQAGVTMVDAVAPAVPVLAPTNGTSISGTAEAGSIVTVTAAGTTATAVADAGGHWTLSPATALPDGTGISVTATDAAGNISAPATETVDATPPGAPTISATNGTVLTGTAEAGATVTLTDSLGGLGGTVTVTADASGHWTYAPPAPLANADIIRATATDAAGNVSGQGTATVDSLLPTIPSIAPTNGTHLEGVADANVTITVTLADGTVVGTTIADGSGAWSLPGFSEPDGTVIHVVATSGTGQSSAVGTVIVDAVAPPAPVVAASSGTEIHGTAEAGATVTVFDATTGATVGTATADAGGHWSVAANPALANGDDILVRAVDGAGNQSMAAEIFIDAIAPTAPVIAATNGILLQGTAEAGATITLTDGSGAPIGSAIVAGNGVWTFAPGAPLANGTVIHATATDAAGNVSIQSATTVDAVAPAAPVLAGSNGTVITGTSEAGATITLTTGTGALIGTTVVALNGSWTITPGSPLANGTVVKAIATDAAGNASAAGATIIDAVAPAAPVLAIDTAGGTMLHGTAEAGALITVKDVNGTVLATTTVAANGSWTATLGSTLANGALVSLTATDAAGNVSGASTLLVDTSAPTAPVIAATNGVTVNGTAEAGSTVTLTDNAGHVLGTTIVAANGHWAITPVVAQAGGTVLHATATDLAGNVSIQGNATVDTTPPAAPTGLSVSVGGTLLSGVVEANATVKVVVNGDPASAITVSADGAGNFTLPLSPSLLGGQTLTVTAIDAAGNIGAAGLVYAPNIAPPTLGVVGSADGYINASELAAAGGIRTNVAIGSGVHVGDQVAVTYNGPGGATIVTTHTVTAGDIALGTVGMTLAGTFPQGASAITASIHEVRIPGESVPSGPTVTSSSVNFVVDTVAPTTPVLSLVNNVLTIASDPGITLTVDAVVAGVHVTQAVTANSSGLASLNLLTGLSANLSWDELLNASVNVYASDAAGNTSTIVAATIADHLVIPPLVGSFALNVALLPPTLGFSGTAPVNGSLSVNIVTPLATVHVAPIVDASGHFAVNLLSASVLSQLGLSVSQLLNLGAGLSIDVVATDAQGHASATYGVSLLGSGASLQLGEITVNGTTGDDILSAATGSVEHFIAGAGNDLIQHVGVGDTVDAGAGNDTIQIHTNSFAAVNGGTGFDTLLFENGINLNYGASGTGTLSGIERVNLGTSGTLTLTSAAVNTLTDGGNVLQITGDTSDTLNIAGAVNTGTTQTIHGSVYDVYHLGSATLLVQEHTVHVTA